MSETTIARRAASEGDRLRIDLAALRFQTALVRLELKYRADQPRKPKGPGGGQFAKDLGAALGMLRDTFAHTATDMVRNALSGAGALNELQRGTMAGVATTLEKVASVPLPPPMLPVMTLVNANGELVVSPYVLPMPLSPTDMHSPVLQKDAGGDRKPVPQGKFDKECNEQYEKEYQQCKLDSALYGRTAQEKKEIFVICRGSVDQRRAECQISGPEGIRSPFYNAQLDHSRDAEPPPKRSEKPGKYNKPIPRGVSLLNFRREKP